MKHLRSSIVTGFVVAALAVSTVLSIAPASASALASAKDTMTRVAISTTSDHTVTFALPTGINFDATGNTDMLRIDFPASFSQSGTWATGDFTLNDGTSRTINAVAQGAGIIDCTVADGVNNVCVAVDTTGHIFSIKPSATYTASATAATVTFTIDGTSADGTLTNPSSAGSASVALAECDETASCTTSFASTHSASVGVGIADNDQVNVTATVDPSLTFDLDTATDGATENGPSYAVVLGTITTSSAKVSGTTDSVNLITLEADTNAPSGVVVTVRNVNGANGLVSTSVSADDIGSTDGAIVAATENYGLCVATSGLSGFVRASPYSTGSCALNTETNDIQGLTTGGENIVSTSGPVASAHAEVVVNAAISGTTPAHADYTDTLTFVATATY